MSEYQRCDVCGTSWLASEPTACPTCQDRAAGQLPCDSWDSRCQQYKRRIESYAEDNKALTAALQAIEAGVEDPVRVARAVLKQPAHKSLFG